jgi:hypoxanthine phosphoribosyltransferase
MTSEATSFQSGRYQVLRKLGEGGKGVVFLCQDTVLRRQVAIKLLNEAGLDSDGVLRFQREVQAMASLAHPNVVTVFDIGQDPSTGSGQGGGRHYLVLELMEGGDVEHLIPSAPNQRLDAATTIRISKEVARALEHAHQHGILHRGVKRLAEAVRSDYRGQCPMLVGVLKGSFVFLADLVREVNMPLTVEFVQVQSYRHTASTGKVRIFSGAPMPVHGRHLLVVEDIVDTGTTVAHLMEWLQKDGPASLRLCALLDKPSRRLVPVQVDYLGFTVPDGFVVGYGLDLDQQYRYLPGVYIAEEA